MSRPEGSGNLGDIAVLTIPAPATLPAVGSRFPVLFGKEPPPGSQRMPGGALAHDGIGGEATAWEVGEAGAAWRRGAWGEDQRGRGKSHQGNREPGTGKRKKPREPVLRVRARVEPRRKERGRKRG